MFYLHCSKLLRRTKSDNMDTEAVEFMLFLKRNVNELKRLGSEWGMSTEEINSCIDKALEKETNLPQDTENRVTPREIWWKFCKGTKLVCKVFVGIIFAIFCFGMVISYNESSSNFIGKILQPYGYDVFRFLRLGTLPIHNMMNITVYYDSECLVENPFYREPTQECDLCEDTTDVKEITTTEPNFRIIKRYSETFQPFVYKVLSPQSSPVSFEDLVDLYEHHREALDKSVNYFHSSDRDMSNLAKVFSIKTDENLKKKSGLSVQWDSRSMSSSQILRKLFPRPPFVPPESEVALEKIVYIDGPDTHHFEVVGGFYQAVFVTVAKGKRKAVLSPVESCRDTCQPLHVELLEGDSLVFGPGMWKVNIMPNIEDYSIVYAGSFTV